VPSGTPLALTGVDFRDASNGWIVGDGGLVLATTNGGASWAPEATPTDGVLYAVSASPGGRVFAGGAGGTLLARLPVACPPIVITPESLPAASAGSTYTQPLSATGGSSPYTFGVVGGALPDGLSLNDTGTISGTPGKPGTFNFAVRAVEAGLCSGDRAYTVDVSCSFTCDPWASQSYGAILTAGFYSGVSTACAGTPGYLWSFGDGATSTEANPTHVYAASGQYYWSLTVTLGDRTCSNSGTVTIQGCQLTCHQSISPSSGLAPLQVFYSGWATTNPFCSSLIPTNAWDFGDGSPPSTYGSGPHTYTNPGTYTWTFTATASGQTCSGTGTVTVTAPCVVACSATVPSMAREGTPVMFDATAAATACGDFPPLLSWDFGDDSPRSYAAHNSHTYSAAGNYTWTLTAMVPGGSCTKTGKIAIGYRSRRPIGAGGGG
jgi:PKD repeat protein